MATRFYLPGGGTASVTPAAPNAAWDNTAGYTVFPTSTVTSGQAVTTFARPKTGTAANTNRLDRQFVGLQPLAAQTIPVGTFSAVMRTVESVATENAWLQIIIRVLDASGAIERGVIFAGQTQTATPSATVGAVNEEFPTTSATRIINALATTSVTTVAGDIICIEFGARIGGTTSTDTFNLRYQDDAGSDFALTSGLTTNLNPWVELSMNLAFVQQPHPINNARFRASNW